MRTSSLRIRKMILASFFTALTAACAQVHIPLPMVPINLALLPVMLCGALLGPVSGFFSMAAYVLMAMIGIPVMSGFTGGIGALLNPTGGYVIGYCLCALITGLWTKRFGISRRSLTGGMLLGLIACYIPGTLWFIYAAHTDLLSALRIGIFPFLPGDCIKIFLAAMLTCRLAPPLEKMGIPVCCRTNKINYQ